MTSRIAFVLLLSWPLACGQVAGLDQEYTSPRESSGLDAGPTDAAVRDAAGPSDASRAPDATRPDAADIADAAPDAEEPHPPSTCNELDSTDNPCASCVVEDGRCDAVCRDQVLEEEERAQYFECLEGDDPMSCITLVEEDQRDRQRDCIWGCQFDDRCQQPPPF